jgi:flagellar basal body-associated protein FliL
MFKRKPKNQPLEVGPTVPTWFRQHKKLAIILSIVSVFLIGGGVAAALYIVNQKTAPEPTPAQIVTPEPEPEPPNFIHLLLARSSKIKLRPLRR